MKLSATHGEHKIEIGGDALVAFVIKPHIDCSPDAASVVLGPGSPYEMLMRTAGCLGTLIHTMIDDPVKRPLIYLEMIEAMKRGMEGLAETDVIENELKPLSEEECGND